MTDEQGQQTRTTQATQNGGAAQPVGPQRMIAGRYALMGELGRGGMGVVWRAEDTVIGRHVAVKELRLPDGAEDAGVFQERVLREVRTGGRLNDPAVVTVYDVVTDADTTFIVMELVEAPTLSDLVRRNGPLAPHQVAMVGDQVLSALRAAHQAGIVHRDVKPGNIMVTPTGRVKLTDFGIAQAVDDPRITTSGMLVGSPAFMAPERVAGREAMPASDLWALGATLYFAVEGTVAFERSSTAATLHAIMNEVPYLTHAQGPLASAIMGLLISSPEARITAEQAGGLLSMAAGQQGQSTPSGGVPTSVYPGQQPPPVPTMVAGHGVTGLAPAGPRSKAKRNGLLIGGVLVAVALLAAGTFLGKWIFGAAVDDAMKPTMTYGATDADIPGFETTSSYNCLNVPLEPGRLIGTSNWVDCDESHDYEYFEAAFPFDSSSDNKAATAGYPDSEQLRSFAESACSMAFNTDRVSAERRGSLAYQALIPSQKAWEAPPAESTNDPTRRIYCMLSDHGGAQLKGTVLTEVR